MREILFASIASLLTATAFAAGGPPADVNCPDYSFYDSKLAALEASNTMLSNTYALDKVQTDKTLAAAQNAIQAGYITIQKLQNQLRDKDTQISRLDTDDRSQKQQLATATDNIKSLTMQLGVFRAAHPRTIQVQIPGVPVMAQTPKPYALVHVSNLKGKPPNLQSFPDQRTCQEARKAHPVDTCEPLN